MAPQKRLRLNKSECEREPKIDGRQSTKLPGQFTNAVLRCVECKLDFTWSAGAQRFYLLRHWTEPKRCKECRGNSGQTSKLLIDEETIQAMIQKAEAEQQKAEKKKRVRTNLLKLTVEGNGKKKLIVVSRSYDAILSEGRNKLGMQAKKEIIIRDKNSGKVSSDNINWLEDGSSLVFMYDK
eukprot:TRINITY_DN17249_c0_g1_i1.p1 TRINITY_DN17249_c0_g1~~TRINITY_DN17249_c0_g1_i1.p1  ORF type:complete len:197 (+),score=39.76 TRINITY_DN17249_c0_g1_i1:50-592(+)